MSSSWEESRNTWTLPVVLEARVKSHLHTSTKEKDNAIEHLLDRVLHDGGQFRHRLVSNLEGKRLRIRAIARKTDTGEAEGWRRAE